MSNEPGFVALSEMDRHHHLHANTNPVEFSKEGPTLLARGNGIYLSTADGHEVIDGMSGGWCTNVGYGNERLCKAAFEAMRELSYTLTFGGRTNRWAAALSNKLAAITPAQYQSFFFASTGSDAVESAIKMALYYWHLAGRPKKRAIISRDLGYHGNTLFAAHLVGETGYGAQFGFPLTDIVHHVASPYWYRFANGQSRAEFGRKAATALETKINELGAENVAAFIGEPLQATLGLIIPPDTYWPEVRRICERYDVLLIADDIVTGLGKTGYPFGFEAFGFEPDLFTLAKGLSSGYFPISCVAVGSKVSEVLQNANRPFIHGFTNCGHPVGAAVALENILVIEDEHLIEKVAQESGPRLASRLAEFTQFPFVGEVSSLGIIGSIEIDISKVGGGGLTDSVALGARIGQIAWKNGVNARPIGSTLGMMFPMIITERQVDDALDRLKVSFAEAWTELKKSGKAEIASWNDAYGF
jgi:putrescine aminotransferase